MKGSISLPLNKLKGGKRVKNIHIINLIIGEGVVFVISVFTGELIFKGGELGNITIAQLMVSLGLLALINLYIMLYMSNQIDGRQEDGYEARHCKNSFYISNHRFVIVQ